MEKGIIEQLDALNEQKAAVENQSDVVLRQQMVLIAEQDLFNLMRKSLLKDVEKKVWETINFFVKVWKLKF